MYFLTADGDIYYYQEATQKMQKLASLATVAGATSPTGNFLLKDQVGDPDYYRSIYL